VPPPVLGSMTCAIPAMFCWLFSESDATALRPHLKSVHLDTEQVLFEAGVSHRHLLSDRGDISLVVGLSSGEIIEPRRSVEMGSSGAFGRSWRNVPSIEP